MVNETPEIVSYFNSEKPPREWTPIDLEFYAFTKQVCCVEGVVAMGCDPANHRFYVKADKKARKNLSRLWAWGNTWHAGDGTLFRVDIIPV